MGLKGYRLWGMGQLDSNVQVPTAADVRARHGEARHGLGREGHGHAQPHLLLLAVAVQAAFVKSKL